MSNIRNTWFARGAAILYSEELKMLQYDAVTRAAEMQRKEDDDAYALLQRHSPSTPVTKAGKRND